MSAVKLETHDGVLVITLDRPKANAIDVATSLELYAAFRTLNDDPALRVEKIASKPELQIVKPFRGYPLP